MANFTCPENPTWNDGIKDLFRPVPDIQHMKLQGIDLSSYDSVKKNGKAILSEVSQGKMPPPPSTPWSKEMVDCFATWIKNGYPEN